MAYEFICKECKGNGRHCKVTWFYEDSDETRSWFFCCEQCDTRYSAQWSERGLEAYPEAIELPELEVWREDKPRTLPATARRGEGDGNHEHKGKGGESDDFISLVVNADS